MAKIFNLEDENLSIDNKDIVYCGEMIRKGELVVFPTETVYGIGANAFDEKSVDKIFKAKGRASDNPLIVHISDMDMLNLVASDITPIHKKLADNFWPGPLTMIFEKTDNVPLNITANLNTVAVRMPSNNIALSLIKSSNVPIAAPSANISGRPSGTNISDIIDELKDRVENIIDGGNSDIGLESTVIKITKDKKIHILRPGKITKEDFMSLGFETEIDEHILKAPKIDEKVESPGMKYRHYAPKVSCILIENGNDNVMIDKINNFLDENKKSEKLKDEIYVIGFVEHEKYINTKNFISIGSKEDYSLIAKNIYSALREVDSLKCDLVLIEGVDDKGIGLAIKNRVIRACEYRIL